MVNRIREQRGEEGESLVSYMLLIVLCVITVVYGFIFPLGMIAHAQFHNNAQDFNSTCDAIIIPGQAGPAVRPPCPENQ